MIQGRRPDLRHEDSMTEKQENQQKSGRQPGHLMIVEDEQAILELITEWVTENSKYRVSTALGAMDALEIFNHDRPDVVLSDIRMPRMSGQDLLREIKRIDPTVPVIMMSGHGDIEDTVEALRAGAQDFFQKPFKMGSLMSSIDRAFAQIEAQKLNQVVYSYMVEEHRRLEIPNDMKLVPHVINSLTSHLHCDPGITDGDVDGIRASLHEMVLNSIEHGNLEITYEEKSQLMETPHGWWQEVETRAEQEKFRDRRVMVEMENNRRALIFTITDQGRGFDYRSLPDPTEMGHALHGRGILIARVHMDEMRYNQKGNQVTLTKFKRQPNETPLPVDPAERQRMDRAAVNPVASEGSDPGIESTAA